MIKSAFKAIHERKTITLFFFLPITVNISGWHFITMSILRNQNSFIYFFYFPNWLICDIEILNQIQSIPIKQDVVLAVSVMSDLL